MDTTSTLPSSAVSSNKLRWTGRILSILLVLLLFMGGIMSWMMPPAVREGLRHTGYPETLARTLGSVEIICAVIYVIPRTAMLGAILLTGYFGGAVATHVRIGEPFFAALICGVLVWVGLFLRDERLRELLPITKRAA
jgi:hypothetical protein